MQYNLDHAIALLERTPGALDELLRGLPAEWTERNEGANSWDTREIVAHLSHGERTDWMPRVRHLLEFGETQPFPPFDRQGQRQAMHGKSMAELLEEFAMLRAGSLDELRALGLGPAELERRGTHPALGSVTLAQLVATWAAHDLTHLHQISRVLAFQYREAVGPWRRFLGVMQCDGHSS
ncbi:MAG TPA: DinB family protein [Terracidiphilus sp.]|nr:DinB family protein [Terracidiphilus sp.]